MDAHHRFAVYQGVVPQYRVAFFARVASRLSLCVISGGDGSDPGVAHVAKQCDWLLPIRTKRGARGLVFPTGPGFAQLISVPMLVVELNPRSIVSLLALFLRKMLGRPTAVWGHARNRSGTALSSNRARKWMALAATGVICYSEHDRKEFAAAGSSRSFAATNASMECRDRTPGSLERALVYSGRLNVEKQLDMLLRALALFETSQRPSLTVIGDGPAKEALESLGKGLGIEASLIFTGEIYDEAALEVLYRRASLFVSPGYVGLNLHQALHFCCPGVVVAQPNNSPELASAESFGRLVSYSKSKSPADIKVAIEMELHRLDEELEFKATTEDLARYQQKVNIDTMADQFAFACEAILEGHGGA